LLNFLLISNTAPWLTRDAFENYAKQNKFDPLVPNNWYSISTRPILLEKNGYEVSVDNFSSLLPSLFPEIGLDAANLQTCMIRKKKKEKN